MGPKKAKILPGRSEIKSQAEKPRKKDSRRKLRTNQFENTPTVSNRKLLRRFYEPLVLLYTLGQSRGRRSQSPATDDQSFDEVSFSEIRRSFLRDLAYVCDYQKGGDTVTAIAVEYTPQGFIFWIAANRNPRGKVESFLSEMLEMLKCTDQLLRADVIASKCIIFAEPRIKAYRRFFEKTVNNVYKTLRKSGNIDEKSVAVAAWLQRFKTEATGPDFAMCKFAYKERSSPEFEEIRRRAQDMISDASSHNVFQDLKHVIGRLGYHFRAAKSLVNAAKRMPFLFDQCEVQIVSTGKAPRASSLVPDVDLKDIVVRMLPAKDAKVPHYQKALADMDNKFNIGHSFRENCRDPNFVPRPHAELIVLEHFYENQLEFLHQDKFIGCSKPACYCCALYIRHHPGQFAQPSSHGKIWLNWKMPEPSLKTAQHHQRDMINDMVKDIRKAALAQIESRGLCASRYPDSTTGISKTLRTGSDVDSVVCGGTDGQPDVEDIEVFEFEECEHDELELCCFGTDALAGLGDDESFEPEGSAYTEARTSFLADDISAIKPGTSCLESGEEYLSDSASDGGVILPPGSFI